jgi:ferredoxin
MERITEAPEDAVDLQFLPSPTQAEQTYDVGTTVTIHVLQKHKPDIFIEAKVGDNLRQVLIDNDFEVYQGMKQKLGNCGGAGQCTFCAMDFLESDGWSERSDYEDQKLAKFPYARLSCLNNIQGPVTIQKTER